MQKQKNDNKKQNVKKLFYTVLAAFAVSISMFTAIGCDDGETYAEQKKKEQAAIEVGKIKIIDETYNANPAAVVCAIKKLSMMDWLLKS